MQRYRYVVPVEPDRDDHSRADHRRGPIADIAHQILFTSIVLLALNAATAQRGRQIVVAVCAVGWLIMDWFDFLAGSARFRIPAGIAFFCLLFAMLYDLLTQLLRVRQTDFDMLSAGVAAYFFWASPGRRPSTSSNDCGRARSAGWPRPSGRITCTSAWGR